MGVKTSITLEKKKKNSCLEKNQKVHTSSSISTEQQRQHADGIACALKSRTV